MQNRHNIEEHIFNGHVLDMHGRWRTLDEALAEEEEYFAHLESGQILHHGEWTKLEDVRSETTLSPFSHEQGRRTTRVDLKAVRQNQEAPKEQAPQNPHTPFQRPLESLHTARNQDDTFMGDSDTKRIIVNPSPLPNPPKTELLHTNSSQPEALPSQPPVSHDSLLDSEEIEDVITLIHNGDPNTTPVADEKRGTHTMPAHPAVEQSDDLDNWNNARSKSTRILIASIIVATLIGGILLALFLI